jgi:hypothetical protein
MAHFARIQDNIVQQVIVIDNSVILDSDGNEQEILGIDFCSSLIGGTGTWLQTSYNGNMRGNYAGIGYTYMSNVATLGVGSTDIFISPQPYASWSISTTAATWEPPSTPGAAPTLTDAEVAAGKYYVWNESNYDADPATAWVLTTPE